MNAVVAGATGLVGREVVAQLCQRPDVSVRALVRKTVVFFLGEVEKEKVKISDEHVGYEWLRGEEAVKRVKYPTAKEVLKAALKHLHDD